MGQKIELKYDPMEKVNHIMESFDFDKVHAYMKLTDWKWHSFDTPKVPDVEDLRKTAHTLLVKIALDREVGDAGSGGFTVAMYDYGISLTFSLERKTSY